MNVGHETIQSISVITVTITLTVCFFPLVLVFCCNAAIAIIQFVADINTDSSPSHILLLTVLYSMYMSNCLCLWLLLNVIHFH